MKRNLIRLSQQYVMALRKYLQQGAQAGLLPALRLGREAVALGLETLDLAQIHEQTVATLKLYNPKNTLTRLAGIFFTEANIPIEETHRAVRQGKVHLSRLKETLVQRTEELAASHRQLRRVVVQCKVMEEAAGKNEEDHRKCLKESLQLQKRLRLLTHRVLATQEDERKHISRELQGEIAQTLVGINVRLLALQTAAKDNRGNLTKEIASTQQVVVESVRSINRFARELDARRHDVRCPPKNSSAGRPAGRMKTSKEKSRAGTPPGRCDAE